MSASASKNKPACSPSVRFCRSGGPTLSHLSGASGTAKVCANLAFVSGVSPVSPNLKLIERIQKKKVGNGRKGISPCQTPCAETGGTSAKVARFYGETTGARHMWDRWDRKTAVKVRRCKNVTFKTLSAAFVVRHGSADGDKVTRGASPKLGRS
jgi:hypothetical protein